MNNLQDKTFRDYLGDIGLYGIVHFLLPFSGLIILPLITKFLGVSDYGIYSLAIATSQILTWLVLLELRSGLLRFLPGEKDRRVISSTFIAALLLILLAEVIILLLTLSFSGILAPKLFPHVDANVYLYIVVFTAGFEASRLTLYIYFRILEQVKRYLMYELLFVVTNIGLIAVAVLFGGDVLYVLLAILLNKIANTGLFLFIFLREQGWAKPRFKTIKPYLVFCLPLIIPQIMAWVIQLSDRYFISLFWGTEEVGIYSAAYGLPVFIGGMNNAIWFVFLPVIFRLWGAGSYEEVRRYFGRAVKLFTLFAIPAGCGLIMLADPALNILSTAEIARESWKVVPFVCLSQFGYAIYGYGADIYQLQQKTRPVAYFVTIGAAVNIAGNFLLIPKYGILGAAIATLIAYITMAAISKGMSRRYFTFPVEWAFIGKALLASVVMSAFLWFFQPVAIWQVVLSIFLGAIIYFVVLFLIRGFNREEVKSVKDFFKVTGKR